MLGIKLEGVKENFDELPVASYETSWRGRRFLRQPEARGHHLAHRRIRLPQCMGRMWIYNNEILYVPQGISTSWTGGRRDFLRPPGYLWMLTENPPHGQ